MSRRHTGKVGIYTRVDPEVKAQVELLLHDPVTNKIRNGALSKLVEQLLRNWLAERR